MAETTVQRLSNYVARKGLTQRGDENTDAFSDNEGEEDDASTRHSNKEAVQVVQARAYTLRSRLQRQKDLPNTGVHEKLILSDSLAKGTVQVAIGVDGVNTISEDTIERSRRLDRQSQTSIYQTTINKRDDRGLDQRVPQTYVTFNVTQVLSELYYAKNYYLFLGPGIVLSLLAGFYLYYSFSELTQYSF